MPLDPDARRMLNLLGAVRGGSTAHSTPELRRQAFRTLALAVGGGRVAIGAVQNTSFPGPGGPLALRIYAPLAAKTSPSPGVIYFHGGGWVSGDFDTHDGICARLAEAGGCRIVA